MAINLGNHKGSTSLHGDWYEFWVEVAESNVNISNNTSDVTVVARLRRISYYTFDTVNSNQNQSITINGNNDNYNRRVDITGTAQWGELELYRRTVTVTHNPDGSKTCPISVTCQTGGGYGAGTCTFNADVILATIPRASSITATNADIGSATSININRASSGFKHTLKYNFADLSGIIASNVDTTYGWTIPTTFYAKIPNTKSGTCTLTCETYNGTTLIGSSTTTFLATVNVEQNKPTISATVQDTNATTYALTNDRNKIVKGYSNANIVTTATAKNSATISSYFISCADGKSGNSANITLNNVESNVFTITVTDSRGISNSITVTKTLVNYIQLGYSKLDIKRVSNTSNTAKLNLECNYFNSSFGSAANTLTLKYRYKVKGSTTWGAYTTINPAITGNKANVTDYTLGTAFDYKTAYEFEIYMQDKLILLQPSVPLKKGVSILSWGKNDVKINGILKVMSGINVFGTASSVPIRARGIEGSDGSGNADDLYINYNSGKNVISNASIIPLINVNKDIGSSSNKFLNGFFKNLFQDGNKVLDSTNLFSISKSGIWTIYNFPNGFFIAVSNGNNVTFSNGESLINLPFSVNVQGTAISAISIWNNIGGGNLNGFIVNSTTVKLNMFYENNSWNGTNMVSIVVIGQKI